MEAADGGEKNFDCDLPQGSIGETSCDRPLPKSDEEVWKLMKSDHDMILEPTVGGKERHRRECRCRKVNA
jgi:hypothetical protein